MLYLPWTGNKGFQYDISRFGKYMLGKRYFQHQTVPVITRNK